MDHAQVLITSCKVCGGKSSGYHFGAVTCEGCKGFFRRQCKEEGKTVLVCSKGGNCPINTHSRASCRHCRYQKCLRAGMSTKLSRIGRQPNSLKYKRLERAEVSDRSLAPAQSASLLSKKRPSSDQAPVQPDLDHLTNAYKQFADAIVSHKNDLLEDVNTSDMKFCEEVTKESMTAIKCALPFIKSIPGFQDLNLEDRIRLTNLSVHSILLIVNGENKTGTNCFTYFNLSSKSLHRAQMLFPDHAVKYQKHEGLFKRIHALDLDATECSLLCVLLLINVDHGHNLQNDEAVDNLQEVFMGLFSDYVDDKYGPTSSRIGSYLLLLPELRKAAIQFNWSQHCAIPLDDWTKISMQASQAKTYHSGPSL